MTLDPDKLHIIRSKPKHDSHSDAIRHFEGDYECLSNTYRCPVSLRGDSEPYPSVEHALQASKTDDAELKDSIRKAKSAIEAKKIARAIKPTSEWRAASEKIVEALVRDKFRRNAKARGVLVGTGHVKLVYTNTHDDRLWGICGGKGENKLGKLLEKVRADALSGKDTDVWCTMRFDLARPLDVALSLIVTKGGDVVAEPSFEGKPVLKMGKLTENEVVMAHPSVSRSHALLVIDRKFGAFLVDLGASNGSFVNGRRLAPFVPEPISPGNEELNFAKSKRTYVLSRVENDLREAKKRELYASMSNPVAVSKPEPDSTVYVGNLDPSTTEADLREFFSECGDIVSIRIPQDKETGKMRGIAFVTFSKHWGVLHALTLNMDDLKGQSVKVRRADSNPDKNKSAAAAAGQKAGKTSPVSSPRVELTDSARRMGSNGTLQGASAAQKGSNDSGGGMSSAVERATAELVKQAALAARANAAALKSNVAGRREPEESGSTRRRVDGNGSSGWSRRHRSARWGDSEGAGDAGHESDRAEHDHRGGIEGRERRYAEGDVDRNGDGRKRSRGSYDNRARDEVRGARDNGHGIGSPRGSHRSDGGSSRGEDHGRGSAGDHRRSRDGHGGRKSSDESGSRGGRGKEERRRYDDSSERPPPRRSDDARENERRSDGTSGSGGRHGRREDDHDDGSRERERRRDGSRSGRYDSGGKRKSEDGRYEAKSSSHKDGSRKRHRHGSKERRR